jgi:hypothetical protein
VVLIRVLLETRSFPNRVRLITVLPLSPLSISMSPKSAKPLDSFPSWT